MKWYHSNHIRQGASINTSPPPSPDLMYWPRQKKPNICGTSPILTALTRCDFEPCRHIASSLHLHSLLGVVILPHCSANPYQFQPWYLSEGGCWLVLTGLEVRKRLPLFQLPTALRLNMHQMVRWAEELRGMWKDEPPPRRPHLSPQELTSCLRRVSIQNRGCYKAAAGRSVQGEGGARLWSEFEL